MDKTEVLVASNADLINVLQADLDRISKEFGLIHQTNELNSPKSLDQSDLSENIQVGKVDKLSFVKQEKCLSN